MGLRERSRPGMRTGALLTAVVLLAGILAPLAFAGVASAQHVPAVIVYPQWGAMNAEGFPPGSTLTFEVEDVGFSDNQLADGDGAAQASVGEGMLEPGMVVSVTDGTTTKELTIDELSIDAFHLDDNRITGSAPAAAEVTFFISCCPETGLFMETTANGDGAFDVDLDTIGGDLTTTSHAEVRVTDVEDDATAFSKGPPNIGADLFNGVHADGFFPGTLVSFEVYAPEGGPLVFAITTIADEFGGATAIDPGTDNAPAITPGMLVRVTDGVYTRELVVAEITITVADRVADTVSGTAPAGALVGVGVEHPSGGGDQVETTASDAGAWTADFGERDEDLTMDDTFFVSTFDADGDFTSAERFQANTFVQLDTGVISAGVFNPNAAMTFEVRDGPGGSILDSGTVTTDSRGEASFSSSVPLDTGMEIVASQSTTGARTFLLPELSVATIDPVTDVATGTAPPSIDFGVATDLGCGLAEFPVTSASDGTWSIDFNALPPEAPPPPFSGDIRARVEACTGGEGFQVSYEKRAPIVSADAANDVISASGFTPGSTVTFDIVSPGGEPIFTGTATVDTRTNAELANEAHGQDLDTGWIVRARDGVTTKSVSLEGVTIDTIDMPNNIVSGTAPSSARVMGEVDPQLQFAADADSSGAWSVQFDPADFFGFDAVDIATVAEASVVDPEGDRSFVRRGAEEEATQTVAAGGTVSTGDSASPEDPLETSVTSPTGGTVTIEERPADDTPAPSTFMFVGQQIDITAPDATATDPIVVVFRVDASQVPERQSATTLQIFRDGIVVPECADESGDAVPDPCVSDRVDSPDGDVEITALTSQASVWAVGVSNDVTPPMVGTATLAASPIEVGTTTTLAVPGSDAGSGVAGGEYFIATDPGASKGVEMTLAGSTLSASIGIGLEPGTYTVGARVRDQAGNWSDVASVSLTVNDAPAPVPPPPPPPEPPPPSPPPPSPPDTVTPAPVTPPPPNGYWMVSAAGAVYAFGDATWLGNASPRVPAVDLERTPDRQGYWIVDASGAVYAFGSAQYHGGAGGMLRPFESVTSMSAVPRGSGYWLFTSLGRVIPFGGAPFLGDMSSVKLNGPVLDSVPTPTGVGYYMVASDGGIFTFGDAAFAGSMGGTRLNAPVQSLVPDSDGSGYWLVASDGGIFAFDAEFYGSMGSVRLNRPVTGMVGFGHGYLMVGEDGGIFSFGDAIFRGSLGDAPPPSPITAVAALA